ncbi:protein CREG1 [Sphaerodactylus townsendi]|uniref:protein CREG1 n=1 Tax=Sphaerodactylus townsendi TaxID=933632 RepID=UPI002026786A|nr:protein CREG1 [Sphaerodactylus townsendi]
MLSLRGLLLLLLAGATAAFGVPPSNETARVARFVAHACDWGALATLSTQPQVQGQPFANVFSISDGELSKGTGVPYMYLTPLEISVKDLQVNGNASLTLSLAQTSYCKDKHYDPQSPLCAHVIFCGVVEKVTGAEEEFGRKVLFNRHPEMEDWPAEHDWFVAKLNIANIWVLSHFGGIESVSPEDYFKATPH